jgi:predicted anti-sigma-YlaC factor YlaD
MGLNLDQIKRLMLSLSMTQDYELNCNEFLDKMAEFAERERLGQPVPDALEAVRHHLKLCAECREEYESLLTTLKRMEKDERRTK